MVNEFLIKSFYCNKFLNIWCNKMISVFSLCNKVKELKPDAWKKLSAPAEASPEPGSMGVVTQRSYHRNDDDDDDTEVVKDDLAKGSSSFIIFIAF